MLFRKKNDQVKEIEDLAEEVKRYKDLYAENKKLLEELYKSIETVDNKPKRGA